MVNNF